jgi:hypothetical protein
VLIIRSEQMKAFEDVARRRFEDEMVEHSRAFSPRLCAVLGEPPLRGVIGGMMTRAEGYGFTFRGPIRLYIEMSFLFGSSFDTDPQYPVLGEQLRAEGDQMTRADRIYEATVLYNRQVSGEGAVNVHRALRELLAFARLPDDISPNYWGYRVLEEMHRIFPEKASYLGDDILKTLIRRAATEAERWNFTATRPKVMMAILMFAFGHRCADDDLYPWIGRAVRDPKIVSADARAQRLERKAITWLEHVVAGNEAGAGR